MYYPCSENKGADQLRSYCEADLRLRFGLCRLFVFHAMAHFIQLNDQSSIPVTDTKLEQNQVAGFLTLLRNMIQTRPTNQDSFVRTNGAAIIGALLQKVKSCMLF